MKYTIHIERTDPKGSTSLDTPLIRHSIERTRSTLNRIHKSLSSPDGVSSVKVNINGYDLTNIPAVMILASTYRAGRHLVGVYRHSDGLTIRLYVKAALSFKETPLRLS